MQIQATPAGVHEGLCELDAATNGFFRPSKGFRSSPAPLGDNLFFLGNPEEESMPHLKL